MLDGAFPEHEVTVAPAHVRLACIADELPLFQFLQAFYADNGRGVSLPMDGDRVFAHVRAACRGEGGVAGIIDAPNGDIAGSVGIFAMQPWYSQHWSLSACWLSVAPTYRGPARYEKSLFEFALQHQRDMNARCTGVPLDLELGILAGTRLAARERLWSRYARKIGAIFIVDGDQR